VVGCKLARDLRRHVDHCITIYSDILTDLGDKMESSYTHFRIHPECSSSSTSQQPQLDYGSSYYTTEVVSDTNTSSSAGGIEMQHPYHPHLHHLSPQGDQVDSFEQDVANNGVSNNNNNNNNPEILSSCAYGHGRMNLQGSSCTILSSSQHHHFGVSGAFFNFQLFDMLL